MSPKWQKKQNLFFSKQCLSVPSLYNGKSISHFFSVSVSVSLTLTPNKSSGLLQQISVLVSRVWCEQKLGSSCSFRALNTECLQRLGSNGLACSESTELKTYFFWLETLLKTLHTLCLSALSHTKYAYRADLLCHIHFRENIITAWFTFTGNTLPIQEV